jgi:hypothetical protein
MTPSPTASTARWRSGVLQVYRLAVLGAIVWLVRELAVEQRVQGDAPITLAEVRAVFTNAAGLRADDSERQGLFVLDRDGRELGYAVRTQPVCRNIIGYAGVTDVLIAFDPDWKVTALKVRSTEDTRTHLEDIIRDRKFLKKWNGLTWDAVAEMDLKKAGIEGVSGATMTSMAMAQSIKARLKASKDELAARPPFRLGWRDIGLVVVLGLAVFMAFSRSPHRHRWRRAYQVALIVYVGFISGDLIAQSLLAGWARAGVPWTTAPGLALLVAAALLLPWATRKPFYCHHICPHGAAQELLGRALPARWRPRLPRGLDRGLRRLPGALLLAVLLVTMLVLPLDLAGIEPFDAYLVRSAGWATLSVAIAGLLASLFVPMAYCHYGCPTGALLEFVRARGVTDRFGWRDGAALMLLLVAGVIRWNYLPLNAWLLGVGGPAS